MRRCRGLRAYRDASHSSASSGHFSWLSEWSSTDLEQRWHSWGLRADRRPQHSSPRSEQISGLSQRDDTDLKHRWHCWGLSTDRSPPYGAASPRCRLKWVCFCNRRRDHAWKLANTVFKSGWINSERDWADKPVVWSKKKKNKGVETTKGIRRNSPIQWISK